MFNIGREVISRGILGELLVVPFIVGVVVLFRRSQTRIPLLVYPDSGKVLSEASLRGPTSVQGTGIESI